MRQLIVQSLVAACASLVTSTASSGPNKEELEPVPVLQFENYFQSSTAHDFDIAYLSTKCLLSPEEVTQAIDAELAVNPVTGAVGVETKEDGFKVFAVLAKKGEPEGADIGALLHLALTNLNTSGTSRGQAGCVKNYVRSTLYREAAISVSDLETELNDRLQEDRAQGKYVMPPSVPVPSGVKVTERQLHI